MFYFNFPPVKFCGDFFVVAQNTWFLTISVAAGGAGVDPPGGRAGVDPSGGGAGVEPPGGGAGADPPSELLKFLQGFKSVIWFKEMY